MTNLRKRLRLALLDLNRPKPASGVQVTYFYHPVARRPYSGSQKLTAHGRRQVRRREHNSPLVHELPVFIWLLIAGGLIAWMQWHS